MFCSNFVIGGCGVYRGRVEFSIKLHFHSFFFDCGEKSYPKFLIFENFLKGGWLLKSLGGKFSEKGGLLLRMREYPHTYLDTNDGKA